MTENSRSVITRFAPSPTGQLHLGGARAAFFSWAYAAKYNGKFIVRIEDTDKARSFAHFTKDLKDSLEWLGINWDDFYYQSERITTHVEIATTLLRDGWAYLDDGAVRLSINQAKGIPFFDLAAGEIVIDNKTLEDPVILRSDQSPTYIFSNAVDDINDKITDIIRGDDHIINSYKQLFIYKALNKKAPNFVHLPMILQTNGQKMSKRNCAANESSNISFYRTNGYLPEALINYLSRLSWSHGNDEIFTKDFFVKNLDLKFINRAACKFDIGKLKWINRVYMNKKTPEWLFEAAGVAMVSAGAEFILARCQTLNDVKFHSKFLTYSPKISAAIVEKIKTIGIHPVEMFSQGLLSCKWEPVAIKTLLNYVVSQNNIKFRDMAMTLRYALTGEDSSPDISQVIYILGVEAVVKRLDKIISHFKK